MDQEIINQIKNNGWILGFVIPVVLPFLWKYRREIRKFFQPADKRRRLDNPEVIKAKLLKHPVFLYLENVLTEWQEMFNIEGEPLKTTCVRVYARISATELKKMLLKDLDVYPTIETETQRMMLFREALVVNYKAVNIPDVFLKKVLEFQKEKNENFRDKIYAICTSDAYPKDMYARRALLLEAYENYARYVFEDTIELLKLLNGDIENALILEHTAGRFKLDQ